jgi:hypothetical protein
VEARSALEIEPGALKFGACFFQLRLAGGQRRRGLGEGGSGVVLGPLTAGIGLAESSFEAGDARAGGGELGFEFGAVEPGYECTRLDAAAFVDRQALDAADDFGADDNFVAINDADEDQSRVARRGVEIGSEADKEDSGEQDEKWFALHLGFTEG